MAGNSASYPFNIWCIARQTMNRYRIMANYMPVYLFSQDTILQIINIGFLNIYNCVWKPAFLKSSHKYACTTYILICLLICLQSNILYSMNCEIPTTLVNYVVARWKSNQLRFSELDLPNLTKWCNPLKQHCQLCAPRF